MANIKTTPEQWQRAREYYEAGLSLAAISDRVGISKAQVGKRANADEWKRDDLKRQAISDAVRVAEAKETFGEVGVLVHNELVDERVKHIQFFTDAATRNVREAMAAECGGQQDYRHRAETINKGRETVLGKSPDTVIQNNVALSLHDVLRQADRVTG